MKRKLLLTLVVLSLFVWVGVKGYQIAHEHAQNALQHVQSRLQQIVGNHGSYSYSKAYISWLTQSVIVENIRLTFVDNATVNIRKIKVAPKDVGSLSSLNIEDIRIESGDIKATIAQLSFGNLTVPAFAKTDNKTGLSWSDIYNISFEQGNMRAGYFFTKWGKFRMGAWRIARQGSARKCPYLFYNIDIAPAIKTQQTASLDAIHLDQAILEMSNDHQLKEKEFFSSFITSTDYFLKAYGVTGIREFKKRVSIGQLNIHLSHQRDMWDGEVIADGLNYNLISSFSIFSQYLKRLGYKNIDGAFHANFTFYSKDTLFTLHKLNYYGDDFLGINLQSRFYINLREFNYYRVNWADSILLKSMVLSIFDSGLKNRLFSISAEASGKTEKQVFEDTILKFKTFSQGKDFDLDRQLYTALTEILMNQKKMLQLSIVFETPERINNLLRMNFLDFFKLINQNNMDISAVSKN